MDISNNRLEPLGKMNRGRPRRFLRDEVDRAIEKRSLGEGDWNDRKKMEEPVERGKTPTAVNAHIYSIRAKSDFRLVEKMG